MSESPYDMTTVKFQTKAECRLYLDGLRKRFENQDPISVGELEHFTGWLPDDFDLKEKWGWKKFDDLLDAEKSNEYTLVFTKPINLD